VGNFYTNVTVMAGAERVVPVLQQTGRDAWVAPAASCCVVFDRETDDQDTEILAALAEAISHDLGTRALAVLNHDDDILWLQLYERGELLTEGATEPGTPTASAAVLARTFGRPARAPAVWLALRLPMVFEVTRHAWLARLLGLPGVAIGTGFNYIEQGEPPPDVEETALIRVRPG
jgi:hypothetical protein